MPKETNGKNVQLIISSVLRFVSNAHSTNYTYYCTVWSYFSPVVILKLSRIFRNVQNERVAGIADTVQRGLGMLPQQAKIPWFSLRDNQGISQTCTGLHCLPICDDSEVSFHTTNK